MAKEEAKIQSEILDFLTSKGFLVVKFSNGAHAVRGGFIRTRKQDVGVSDIIGCTPDGRFFACEVKKPGGKPSLAQLDFIEKVKQKGGIGMVVESLAQLIQNLTIV